MEEILTNMLRTTKMPYCESLGRPKGILKFYFHLYLPGGKDLIRIDSLTSGGVKNEDRLQKAYMQSN